MNPITAARVQAVMDSLSMQITQERDLRIAGEVEDAMLMAFGLAADMMAGLQDMDVARELEAAEL